MMDEVIDSLLLIESDAVDAVTDVFMLANDCDDFDDLGKRAFLAAISQTSAEGLLKLKAALCWARDGSDKP